ncbi:MAG: hypothetical protein QF886_14600 [Planctomycetota bacterium]|jgi:DNA-directed RNA polymerase subunit RPC12/RpoP|nr:hypothetical protein [Planctomycetota bacterium]
MKEYWCPECRMTFQPYNVTLERKLEGHECPRCHHRQLQAIEPLLPWRLPPAGIRCKDGPAKACPETMFSDS